MLLWIEDHPGLASWIQAIGTVLAIVVAVALPYFQRRGIEKASAETALVLMAHSTAAFDRALGHVVVTGQADTASFGEVRTRCSDLLTFRISDLSAKKSQAFGRFRVAALEALDMLRDPSGAVSVSAPISKFADYRLQIWATYFAARRKLGSPGAKDYEHHVLSELTATLASLSAKDASQA